jgi:hypothetical protein
MFQIYEKWVGADALRASAVFGAMRAASGNACAGPGFHTGRAPGCSTRTITVGSC